MKRVLHGGRVRVRPGTDDDLAPLLKASDITPCSGIDPLVIEEISSNEPVGYLQVEWVEGSPVFVSIALVTHLRGRGLGGEAVRIVESQLAGGAREFRALVSRDRGLALYFWLRLGYRPRPDAASGRYDGDVITMVRTVPTA